MTEQELDHVWREIGRIGTCMMVSLGEEGLRARPMVGTAERSSNAIWFIIKREDGAGESGGADAEGRVCLAYMDLAQSIFLSISGRAEIMPDHSKLRDVWNSNVDHSFDGGPDDPAASLLRVTPQVAEYWDDPNFELYSALERLTASSPGWRLGPTQTNRILM